MKICFVLPSVSSCGGTERVCLKIASALADSYDVHILSMRGTPIPYFDCNHRVKVHRLLPSVVEDLFSTHPKMISLVMRLFFLLQQFDLVIDTFLMDCNLSLPALKGLKTRHLIWCNFSYERFKTVEHEQIALKKVIASGSHILVLTKEDRRLYIENEGVDPEIIHQIYNPLTFDVLSYTPHDSKTILSIGRFAPEKGFDMLIKAWKIVEDKIPDWTLEIWGDTGEDTGRVYATYQEVKPERLSLHPATKNIQEKYKEASFYVMSSRHEGFPLVLLEALSYSLPVVSFNCPNGPREIIQDGDNGILVEPEIVGAMSSAILHLIRDKELREGLGKRAYERSKDYQMDKIIPQWITLIENAIKS